MNFKIIYEDDHALVIDKPVGVMVHPDERNDEKTISDWCKDVYKITCGDEGREGIVHRLDRNTTGVLLLAKDIVGFNTFKKQFKNHTTRKVYRAIVEGNIRDNIGMISAPVARAKSDFRKRTIVDMFNKDQRGEEREAITRFKVISRSNIEGKSYSYVDVYPLTGRTHQIRAHFRGIRHPIIGDDLYGSRIGKDLAERSMLHALSLSVKLPGGEEKTFFSDIPEDMLRVLEKLKLS